MARRSGLGRGLDSLIPGSSDQEVPAPAAAGVTEVPVGDVDPNPHQPREHFDEDALVDAIESGKVKGAALDVFAVEPLQNERLLQCEKISLTPHIGAATAEAQARIGDNIVDIIKEVL